MQMQKQKVLWLVDMSYHDSLTNHILLLHEVLCHLFPCLNLYFSTECALRIVLGFRIQHMIYESINLEPFYEHGKMKIYLN